MNRKVILITGANGGLGRALAETFLQESEANGVWMAVHEQRSQADALAKQYPERSHVARLDVTDAGAWPLFIKEVVAASGRLDVLVNNAGFHRDSLLGMMTPEMWRQVISVNLDAVFYGCQSVLPTMVGQRSGRIINVASLSALLAPAGQTNYAAAKAGVIALTQSLAKEVARLGITVNAVCPGYIETEALAGLDEAARQLALRSVPMRRFGKPDEVAAAVRFLACAQASYITGSVLKIDGGIL